MPGTTTSTDFPRARSISFRRVKGRDYVGISLTDGRVVGLPLVLYPTLLGASARHRRNWRLIGQGHGIHWPDLDLDLSTEGMLAAQPEHTASARRALESIPMTDAVLEALLDARPDLTASTLADLIIRRYSKQQLQSLLKRLEARTQSSGPRSTRKKSA